jgi:pimeloyl-ACP methyl ester carboxylesterase
MGSRRSMVQFVLILAVVGCPLAGVGEEPAPFELPKAFTHGTAVIEGMKLAWAERPGNEPSLVLIPGTFNDCRIYSAVVASLDPERRTVIVEHAGHGSSWPPDPNASIERCADQVIFVLDRLKIDSCYLGGHSLGGMVAMEAGRRYPERFRGIISMEGWTNSKAAEAAFHDDMKSTLSPALRARIDAHRYENVSPWPSARQKAFVQIWTSWDGIGFLRETDLRVLQLYGDRSGRRPSAAVLGIPARPNIRLEWLSGASHWLRVEQPAEVAAAIEAFIAPGADDADCSGEGGVSRCR